jgi:hypothetical protein
MARNRRRPDCPCRIQTEQAGIAFVQKGDPSSSVTLHHRVELRLDQAAIAFLALGEPPKPVLQLLDLALARTLVARSMFRGSDAAFQKIPSVHATCAHEGRSMPWKR